MIRQVSRSEAENFLDMKSQTAPIIANATIPSNGTEFEIEDSNDIPAMKQELIDNGLDFGTEEKPWMKSRFTVMLPIKFNVNKKCQQILSSIWKMKGDLL